MSISTELDFPADDVWAVVSDFGGLPRWNDAVTRCIVTGEGVGAVRTFSTKLATVQERIEAFDRELMIMIYSIVSGSSIKVRDARLRIAVTSLNAGRCQFDWSLNGEPDGTTLAELEQSTRTRYLGRIEDLRRALDAKNT